MKLLKRIASEVLALTILAIAVAIAESRILNDKTDSAARGGVACDTKRLIDQVCPPSGLGTCLETFKKCSGGFPNTYLCEPNSGILKCNNGNPNPCFATNNDVLSPNCP